MKFLSRLLFVFMALCFALYVLPLLGFFGSVVSHIFGPKSFMPELIRHVPEMTRVACWHIYGILIAVILSIWLNAPSSSTGERKLFYIWDNNLGITGPKAFGELRNLPDQTLVWSIREPCLDAWFPLRSWHNNGSPRNSRRTQVFTTALMLTVTTWHTYHNFGVAPATILLGTVTVACGSMAFVVQGSGKVSAQAPESLFGAFSNSPRPPFFAVHGEGSHTARKS